MPDPKPAPGRCPYPFPANDGEHRLDHEPGYHLARSSGALMPVTLPFGGDAYLASSYQQVREVLQCPDLVRHTANSPDTPRLARDLLPPGALLSLDGPEHARLRREIASTFSARNSRLLRPVFEAAARRLLDTMTSNGPGPGTDLIAAFTDPLTAILVSETIGWPVDVADELLGFLDTLTSPCEPGPYAETRARYEALVDTITADGYQRPPGLVEELARSRSGPSRLSITEISDLLLTVYAGGARTPSIMMSSAVLILLGHADQLALLCEQPGLWPGAVEELLRYIPIGLSGGFPRTATTTVTIAGHTIKEGETVLPATISANFDPDVFTSADTLDVRRSHNPHLAFGAGPHRCPGARLTRDLAEVALPLLFERLPALKLATLTQTWHSGLVVRAMTALPVQW